MRPIDADALYEQAANTAEYYCGFFNDMENVISARDIEQAPTIDAVPVVRCGQCRFTKTDGTDDPAIYCEKWDRWEMPPDFYCSYGERKDGDGNE